MRVKEKIECPQCYSWSGYEQDFPCPNCGFDPNQPEEGPLVVTKDDKAVKDLWTDDGSESSDSPDSAESLGDEPAPDVECPTCLSMVPAGPKCPICGSLLESR